MKYINIQTISGWCAGCKVSGFSEQAMKAKDFPKLSDIIYSVAHDYERSCVVISSNTDELYLNEWLVDNGFVKGPSIQNWNHDGRLTNLWFLQIDKDDFPVEDEDYYDEDD